MRETTKSWWKHENVAKQERWDGEQPWEHESCEKTKKIKEKWNDWNVKSMASSGELKTSSIMMVSWEHPS